MRGKRPGSNYDDLVRRVGINAAVMAELAAYLDVQKIVQHITHTNDCLENLADKSLAIPHKDLMNLVSWSCCVFPLGTFNPKNSAQLILHQARGVIIELGLRDTFYFPSACLDHSNAPLASEERLHKSFGMYSAGGLFWWVAQELKEAPKDLKSKAKPYQAQATVNRDHRWTAGWQLYSAMADVLPA